MAAAVAALTLTGIFLAGAQSAYGEGNASVDPIKVTVLGPDGKQRLDRTQPYDAYTSSVAVKVVVANTGSTTVEDIAVKGTSAVACPATSLTPGASMNCTAQVAFDGRGEAIGQFNVKAVDSDGVKLLAGGLFYGRAYQDTKLGVVLTSSLPSPQMVAGVKVIYTATLTNSGTTAVTNISNRFFINGNPTSVTGVSLICPKTTLALGESMSCGADKAYTVTPADEAASYINAIVAVDGTPVLSAVTGSAPAVLIAKENAAGAGAPTAAGNPITWHYTVLNTGDVALTNVAVADDQLTAAGLAVSCPKTTLAPEEFMVCTGTQVPEPGQYTNTATVTSAQGAEDSDSWTAMIVDARFGLTKTATLHPADTTRDRQDVARVGDTIDYTFDVKNTGNVPLGNVVISDAMLANAHLGISCPETTLTVGATMTCTADPYTVTKNDVAQGKVHNIATVTGTPIADTTYPDVTQDAQAETGTEEIPIVDDPTDPTDDPTDPADDPTDPADDPTTEPVTDPTANPTVADTANPNVVAGSNGVGRNGSVSTGSGLRLASTGAQILLVGLATAAAITLGGTLLLARRRLSRRNG